MATDEAGVNDAPAGASWLQAIQQDCMRLPAEWLPRLDGILLSAKLHLSAHVSLLACHTPGQPPCADHPAAFVVVASSSAGIWALGTVCSAEPGSSLAAVLQQGEPIFSDDSVGPWVAAAAAMAAGMGAASNAPDGGSSRATRAAEQQQHYTDWAALRTTHGLAHFAAVPIMHGRAVVGVLAAASKNAMPYTVPPVPSPPPGPSARLGALAALRQLSFGTSVALCAGDGAARMHGLAHVLHSLEQAPSLAALVHVLCAGMEEHIWKALQLQAQARVALVPEGPQGTFALLLLTHGSPEEAAAAADSSPSSRRATQARYRGAHAAAAIAAGASGGGGSTAARVLSAALAPESGSRRHLHHLPLQPAAEPAADAAAHRLAVQASGTPGLLQQQQQLQPPPLQQPLQLQRNTVTGMLTPWHAAAPAMAGQGEGSPAPEAAPMPATGRGAAKAHVPHRLLSMTASPHAPLMRYASAPSNVFGLASGRPPAPPDEASGDGGRPAVLEAQPLLLSCTLLQQLLRQRQQPAPRRSTSATTTDSNAPVSADVASAARPMDAAARAPASASVLAAEHALIVPDCQRHLHDAVAPCRDVLKLISSGVAPRSLALMGIVLSTAADTASGSGAGGGSGTGSAGAGGGGTTPRVGAPEAPPAAAPHNTSGSVLLALYLSFRAPVPGPLLQSAVGICQELMTGPLLPLLERKLAGELAAELAVLRAGAPGDYAVTPPPAAGAAAAGQAAAVAPRLCSSATLHYAHGGAGSGAGAPGSGDGFGSHPGSSEPGASGGGGGTRRRRDLKKAVPAGAPAVGSDLAAAVSAPRSQADMQLPVSMLSTQGATAAAGGSAIPDAAAYGPATLHASARASQAANNAASSSNVVRMLMETNMLALLEEARASEASAATAAAVQQHAGFGSGMRTTDAGMMATGSAIAPLQSLWSSGGSAVGSHGAEAATKSWLRSATDRLTMDPAQLPAQRAVQPPQSPRILASLPPPGAPLDAPRSPPAAGAAAPAASIATSGGGAGSRDLSMDVLQLPANAPGTPRPASQGPLPPAPSSWSKSPSLDLYRQAKGFIRISDLEAATDMRAQLGSIVQGLRTSIHSAASSATFDTARLGSDADLPALRLTHVMGQGGVAIVFKGRLAGGAPVAVKVFEVPDVEATTHAHATLPLGMQLHRWRLRRQRSGSAGGGAGAGGGGEVESHEEEEEGEQGAEGAVLEGGDEEAPVSEEEVVKRRRRLMRGAIELAVLTAVSSPHVVQVLWYCPNATLEESGPPCTCGVLPDGTQRHCRRHSRQQQQASRFSRGGGAADSLPGTECLFRLQRVSDPASFKYRGTGASPLCTAVVMEWCDCGSLLEALQDGAFHEMANMDLWQALSQAAKGGAGAGAAAAAAAALGAGAGGDGGWSAERRLGPLNMRAVLSTLLEVAMALRHLHALGIVHRDVKPANVLLRSNPLDPRGFSAKLADFGFALLLPEGPDGTHLPVSDDDVCGTATHVPPESLLPGHVVHTSVDVFSFGILMWEMTSAGVRPYRQLQPHHIAQEVVKGVRPAFGSGTPFAYRLLAQACWSAVPKQRPTAAELVARLTEMLEAGL